jgi:hypothetical protein
MQRMGASKIKYKKKLKTENGRKKEKLVLSYIPL